MIMFYCPSMASLARRVERAARGRLRQGNIRWSTFEDGYPDVEILDAEMIRGRKIVFLASFDNPADIFSQLAVMSTLARLRPRRLIIVLPYFAAGTIDRATNLGTVVAADTMAKLFNVIQKSATMRFDFLTFDIHTLAELKFFPHYVRVHNLSAIHHAVRWAHAKPNRAVAFPDEGAYKRYSRHFMGIDIIACKKKRVRKGRHITIMRGDPRGREVLIVDDLVKTGKTLLACRDVVRKAGAHSVSTFIVHGVFSRSSWRHLRAKFNNIYFTDSCPHSATALNHSPPFHVFSLSSDIALALLK